MTFVVGFSGRMF